MPKVEGIVPRTKSQEIQLKPFYRSLGIINQPHTRENGGATYVYTRTFHFIKLFTPQAKKFDHLYIWMPSEQSIKIKLLSSTVIKCDFFVCVLMSVCPFVCLCFLFFLIYLFVFTHLFSQFCSCFFFTLYFVLIGTMIAWVNGKP